MGPRRSSDVQHFKLKTTVIGAPGVGKSSLVARWRGADPSHHDSHQTGPAVHECHCELMGGVKVDLHCWDVDTDISRSLVNYCRSAQGLVLVWDLTQPETSLAWLRSALTLVSESWGDVSPVLSLVANKADVSWAPDGDSVDELALEQLLSPEALTALRQLMKAYNLKSCCYASAATGQGCKAALTSIAADLAGVPERLWVSGQPTAEANGGGDRSSHSSLGQGQSWFLGWVCCMAPSAAATKHSDPYVGTTKPESCKVAPTETQVEEKAVPAVS